MNDDRPPASYKEYLKRLYSFRQISTWAPLYFDYQALSYSWGLMTLGLLIMAFPLILALFGVGFPFKIAALLVFLGIVILGLGIYLKISVLASLELSEKISQLPRRDRAKGSRPSFEKTIGDPPSKERL